MWNPQDYAVRHYYNVELMAQRWQEQQEGYAPSLEVGQSSEHVGQLPEQPNPSAASDFEMALLQNFLMQQQKQMQPQQQQMQQQLLQLQMQQQQQQQQQQLQQLQQMQQMHEAAMGSGLHPALKPEASHGADSVGANHQADGADEAELARCYEQAVSDFLNDQKSLEDDDEDDADEVSDEAEDITEDAAENSQPAAEDPGLSLFKRDDRPQEEIKRGRGRTKGGNRFWCCFHLHEAYLQYKVVPCIIGKGGYNTRAIFQKTGAKVRVRGRGSGHLESGTNTEAPTGPMLTVSSPMESSFNEAIQQTAELLLSTQKKMQQLYPEIQETIGDLCWHCSKSDGQTYRLQEDGKLVLEDSDKLKRAKYSTRQQHCI